MAASSSANPGAAVYLKRASAGRRMEVKPVIPGSLQRRPRAHSAERRTWGTYNYASLWVAMSVCIPTYMLASGLIAGGMSWWQAIGTILLGNLIVLVPMLLNAHAGAKYGIPFPVFVRASFGVRGANIPGGAARAGGVRLVRHSDLDRRPGHLFHAEDRLARLRRLRRAEWICFFAFWALNMSVIWRGIETIKFLEGIGAPFMLAVGLLLLWWITGKAGGLGPVLSAPSKFHTTGRIRALLHSLAHRDGGLLGHGGAEHSGFHALRQIAKGADGGAGAGAARRHDALFVHRRGRDVGLGGAVRRSRSGIRWRCSANSISRWWRSSRWSRC